MRVRVSLLRGTFAATLRKVELSVKIEGQEFSHVVEPEANLTQVVEWDGRDVYGSPVVGKTHAQGFFSAQFFDS